MSAYLVHCEGFNYNGEQTELVEDLQWDAISRLGPLTWVVHGPSFNAEEILDRISNVLPAHDINVTPISNKGVCIKFRDLGFRNLTSA